MWWEEVRAFSVLAALQRRRISSTFCGASSGGSATACRAVLACPPSIAHRRASPPHIACQSDREDERKITRLGHNSTQSARKLDLRIRGQTLHKIIGLTARKVEDDLVVREIENKIRLNRQRQSRQ